MCLSAPTAGTPTAEKWPATAIFAEETGKWRVVAVAWYVVWNGFPNTARTLLRSAISTEHIVHMRGMPNAWSPHLLSYRLSPTVLQWGKQATHEPATFPTTLNRPSQGLSPMPRGGDALTIVIECLISLKSQKTCKKCKV